MSGISLGTTLSTKKSRIVAASVATVALTGALVATGVNAHADDVHKKQVAAAAETHRIEVKIAADKVVSDKVIADKAAADKAAADKAAAEKAAAEKAAADKAAADKAAADKAAADKAPADKAAADKAAADKAAADKIAADRAAAVAQANRDAQRQQLPTSSPTTTSSGSSSGGGSTSYSSGSVQAIAASIVPADQFGCFSNVVSRESGWNVHATNSSSGAYGLGQALPASKMASAGSDWQDNPTTQIKWVLSYMDSRYGSPCGAWSFWQSHSWY